MNSRTSRSSALACATVRKAIRVFAPTIGVLLAWLPIFCQTYAGRILGTVQDPSGAVIPGATVTITDMQRGITRSLTTDTAGEDLAPQLVPGPYKLYAEAPGLKQVEGTNVAFQGAHSIRLG